MARHDADLPPTVPPGVSETPIELTSILSPDSVDDGSLNQAASTPATNLRLGDYLLDQGIITEDQLKAGLAEQKSSGRKLGRVLVESNIVTDLVLKQALAKQLDLPFIDLAQFNLNQQLVHKLEERHARRYRALVLKERPAGYLIGMVDPTDLFAFDELSKKLDRPVLPAVVCQQELLQALENCYQRSVQISSLATELQADLDESYFDLENLSDDQEVAEAPVVRLLQTIFEDAVRKNASDIHIEPDETVLRIRNRIDGLLHENVMDEKRIAPALVSRLKLMAGLDISEKRLPQDGRFSVQAGDKSLDIRLATIPIQHGESVVMRLLNQDEGIRKLDQLGMPPTMLAVLQQEIHRPHGMVLVTGPTGSGKTTTLYGALSELNTPNRKIVTVEDPVEYRLPRINQVQVNQKVGLDFSRFLRAALRLDPDVILVGEIRDLETAQSALRAALTGHMVMSTLHTNDAISTTLRLMDMGLESYLVASAINCIVAQRLVRQICNRCRQPAVLSDRDRIWLEATLNGPGFDCFEGTGCNQCNDTGYLGRIGVYELLRFDEPMMDALRREDQSEFSRLAVNSDSYHPIISHCLDKLREGTTTIDEVMRLSGSVS